MRNLLLILALQTSAACATLHLPPPEFATDEDEARKPVLLASAADVGATVSDWYTRAVLTEPYDPNRPTFLSARVRGALTVGGALTVYDQLCFSAAGACTDVAGVRFTYAGAAINLAAAGSIRFSIAHGSGAIVLNPGTSVAITGTGLVSSQAANGNNAFSATTNGARFDFGAGASDYASSDGTTVTFAGPISANGLTNPTTTATGLTFTDANAVQRITWGNSQYLGNTVSTGLFLASSGWTQSNSIGTAASGTGITAAYTGALRQWVHKVTVINTALAAAGTSDVTLHVTPVNSRIVRVVAEVTQVFTGGALSAVAVTCGKTAGGNEYLLSHSQLSATGAFGDVVAEMGAGVVSATLADMGTVATGVPGAITVQCRYTCTGANCSAATQGSTTYYVEGVTY